MLINITR